MLVAGNWKMHTDLVTARNLARDVVEAIRDPGDVNVVVCPPAVSLHAISEVVRSSPVGLGAQNMHDEEYGAYTGEISAPMLRSVGCQYVILGHSERREYFGETDAGVNAKIKRAFMHDLVPIVCVGELLEDRQAGRAQDVVRTQVEGALAGIAVDDPDWLVMAYEPVWAIGTGETATPKQAQEMHGLIRSLLKERFGENKGRKVEILYGGSVKPQNAEELFEQQDVTGGLIGGASLNAEDFVAIVRAA